MTELRKKNVLETSKARKADLSFYVDSVLARLKEKKVAKTK